MAGESQNSDLKIKVDFNNAAEKLEFVKNIVALANSGGGELVIGKNEKLSPGITSKEVSELDSARTDDLVRQFIKPAQISVGHDIRKLRNGKFILTIKVSAAEFPIVFSKQGFDEITKKPIFRKGDIWTRHSTKTEPIEYEDIRKWIEAARAAGRDQLKDQLLLVSKLPAGAEIKAVTSGGPISSPNGFLENETNLRSLNRDHLIEPYYLNWLFLNREALKLSRTNLAVLLASALRRSATLYWWLISTDEDVNLIRSELFGAVEAQDRDKSDAAKNIVDIGSVYLTDQDLKMLITNLSKSKYSHFKKEARLWQGRQRTNARISRRIRTARLGDRELLIDKSLRELRELANSISEQILEQKSNVLARQLSDVNVVMWNKTTKRLA